MTPHLPDKTGKIRIACVFNTHFIMGGGEISFLALIRSLDRRAWEPIAIVPKRGEISETLAREGIESQIAPAPPLREVVPPLFALLKLISILKESRSSLIHANGSRACFYSVLAGKLLGIPVIWHVRETIRDHYLYERFLLSLSKQVICASESIRGKRFGGFPDRLCKKIRVIYNGVDTALFQRNISSGKAFRDDLDINNEDTILFGMVANFIPLKGQDLILRALVRMKQIRPDLKIKILFTGRVIDTSFHQMLHVFAADHKLNEDVMFLDYSKRVVDVLSALDVFLLPSEREGFSRSLIEAMSVGLPVIASRLSEIEEAAEDNKTGILVPHGDIEGLAEAMIRLAKDPELRSRMGELGRETVLQRFGQDIHTQHIHGLYSEIINSGRYD